jgi:type I restriction enzyme R subunit
VTIFDLLTPQQQEFIEFVLNQYIAVGVDELDQEKLPILLQNKYMSLEDAKAVLGDIAHIRQMFIDFQKHLYDRSVA